MSLQTDMQGLIAEKMARLEAQLEVERQKSRIKDLEQKVHTLEVEKGLSAQKPDDQALRPAVTTGIPDFILQDKIETLETQLEAKNTKIAQQAEEVSALLEKVRIYREVCSEVAAKLREAATLLESNLDEDDDDIVREDAAFQGENGESMAGATAEEHELQKELTPRVSVNNTNESAKPLSTSPPTEIEEDIEEADQGRSHSPALRSPSHTFVSDWPASTSLAVEKGATLRASNLKETFLWPRRMRCAFMTKADDNSIGPIGDPFQAMNGWAVHLEIDAGRHGRPNISLHFSINNGKPDAPVSRKRDQRTEFAVTWRTSGVNDQSPMIETFEAGFVSDYPRSRMPDLPMIVDKCPGGRQQELTNLIALGFRSNSIEKPEFSATTKKLWRGLPIDVQQCLDILFFRDEPRVVTIWFCVESSPELAMRTWILALQRAVNPS